MRKTSASTLDSDGDGDGDECTEVSEYVLSHRHNTLEFMGRTNRFLDLVLERPGVPEGCTL